MTTNIIKCINRKGLILALLLFSFFSSLWAYDFSADNNGVTIYYNIIDEENNYVSVTYEGDTQPASSSDASYSGDVTIPETIEYTDDNENEITCTVTEIGDYAFEYCSELTAVTIPSTVVTIGYYAFGYSGITSFEITGNPQLTTIGRDAFYCCKGIKSVTFPNTLTTIGIASFYHCEQLESVTIPSNVTSVGESAFQGCTSLQKAIVEGNPETYTQLGYCEFSGCSALKEITLGVDNLDENGTYGNVKVQWGVCMSENDSYTSDNTVYCKSLKTVTIGKGVQELGPNCFLECTALETINYNAINCTLVNAVGGNADGYEPTTYEYTVFEDCYNVKELNIGDEVTKIPDYLFTAYYDNDDNADYEYSYPFFGNLTTIDFPPSVTEIGQNAFYGCAGLKTLTFEGNVNVTKIGAKAFCRCGSLETVTFGDVVTEIGDTAFYHCNKLKTVYENTSVEKLKTKVPKAGEDCFTKVPETGQTEDDLVKCFLVVPEDAARFYTAKVENSDSENNQGYVGYGAISPTADGWKSIPNLREDTVTIPITTAEGYVTRYSPYSYTLAEGLKGGIITDVDDDGNLTINWAYDGSIEGKDTVPAGSAILIKGSQGEVGTSYVNATWNTHYTADALSVSESGSMMYGTENPYYNDGGNYDGSGTVDMPDDKDKSDEYLYYKLSYYTNKYGVKELGFYMVNKDGTPFTINSGKGYDTGVKLAWLVIPKDDEGQSGVRAFYPLDANSTGIETIEATYPNGEAQGSCSDVIYNMQGMRVKDMTKKGIYIVNGKKVMR